MNYFFDKFADNTNPNSIASRMRRKRLGIFKNLFQPFPEETTLRILDLGGDPWYWEDVCRNEKRPIEIILLNRHVHKEIGDPRIISIVGDARELSQFKDQSYEIVYSNSLIEHLGSNSERRQLAFDICRIGQAYFVQTPNRYFPLEPHFLIPYFQFFPQTIKTLIAKKFKPGWYRNRKGQDVINDAKTIKLLTRLELEQLFPDGNIFLERILGITKSFIVYREKL